MRRDWWKWTAAVLFAICSALFGGAMSDWRGDVEMARVLDAVSANSISLQQHVTSVHPLTQEKLAQINIRLEKLEQRQEKIFETLQKIQIELSRNGG